MCSEEEDYDGLDTLREEIWKTLSEELESLLWKVDVLLESRRSRGRGQSRKMYVWWVQERKTPWTEIDGEASSNVKLLARGKYNVKRRK